MSVSTGSIVYDLVAVSVALVAITVAFFKWRFTYWERRGLQTINPVLLYGDTKDLLQKKTQFGEEFEKFYNIFKKRGLQHGGVYVMHHPVYLPVDPEIIKAIMQKDFQHFYNRGIYVNEVSDPLSGSLFSLEDAKWKHMRAKLTPTFTSGKMKMMFQILVDCAAELKDVMDDLVSKKEPVDIKDILGRFTTDIIGSCAFGIECNTLKNPDSEFRKYGKKHFDITGIQRLKNMAQFILPHWLLRIFHFRLTRKDVTEFMIDTIRATVDYREKNNIYRKDFLHLLIQLKNRGKVEDDGKIVDESGVISEHALTINEVAAQAFVFFVAGFETSSTASTFALYEIAINPHVQNKLREEINTVLLKHNDQITYEAIKEMTYLDHVINETLRKYPPIAFLPRSCTKDYTVPGTSVIIEKGTDVIVPIYGIQRDPEYYPDPLKFDPDRFTEENKAKRPPFTFLPFGEGPRNCIGLRFGMMQTKVGLVALLRNYNIKLSKKTKTPLTMETESVVLTAEGGIWLDVEPLT